MAFGNPYNDLYNEDIVVEWIDKITAEGIAIISLADTVGIAEPAQVSSVTKKVITAFPEIEVGVHLHSANKKRQQKLNAAFQEGCRRFDGALKGVGGCPMAKNELVGNMDSEFMITYFQNLGYCKEIDKDALAKSIEMAEEIFS